MNEFNWYGSYYTWILGLIINQITDQRIQWCGTSPSPSDGSSHQSSSLQTKPGFPRSPGTPTYRQTHMLPMIKLTLHPNMPGFPGSKKADPYNNTVHHYFKTGSSEHNSGFFWTVLLTKDGNCDGLFKVVKLLFLDFLSHWNSPQMSQVPKTYLRGWILLWRFPILSVQMLLSWMM